MARRSLAAFAANLDVGTCAPAGLGAGLEAAKRAIGALPPAEPGERREISVIIFTAEDDHSPDSIDAYQAAFAAEGVWGVSVVGPTAACDGIVALERYLSMAERMGGARLPICQPEEWKWLYTPIATGGWTPEYRWSLDPAPIDWNGDGFINEEDGFQVFLDGAPLPSRDETRGRRWLFMDGVFRVYAAGLHARAHLEARYPASCVLSQRERP